MVQNLIDKLFAFGKIWGEIKYFSPYIHLNEIDWNNVFCNAYTEIKNSKVDQFANIIDKSVLSKLGDPLSGVLTENEILTDKENQYRILDDNIAYLAINNYEKKSINSVIEKAIKNADKTNGLILDIDTRLDYVNYHFKTTDIFSYFIDKDLVGCNTFSIEYCGFPDETIHKRNQLYSSSYNLKSSESVICSKSKKNIPIVFILHEKTPLYSEIIALRSHEKCLIINTNPEVMRKMNFYNSIDTDFGSFTYSYDVPIFTNSTHQICNDFDIPKNKSIDYAIKMINEFDSHFKQRDYLDLSKQIKCDTFEQSFTNPSDALRVLSIVKIYSVIKYFYPHETDKSITWDNVAKVFIKKAIEVDSYKDFVNIIKEMGTYIDDVHVHVKHKPKDTLAKIPIKIDYLEDRFVITSIFDEHFEKTHSLEVGNIITKINFDDIEDDYNKKKKYLSGSREIVKRRNFASEITMGSLNEEYVIEVESHHRSKSTISDKYLIFNDLYDDKPIKEINNNVLYVKLYDLKSKDKDALDNGIINHSKLILDMRGYPSYPYMQELLRALSYTNKFYWGKHKIPIINYNNTVLRPDIKRFQYSETIINTEPKYKRKVAVLLNHQTQSYAEAICDSLKANCNAILIGSNSAGANGNVSWIKLPSDIEMSFTGMIHYQHNGKTEQKVGITPDHYVEQTIDALQNGRDLLIEKAIEVLSINL
jgi:C-terminal processing protease CtpA/Prc